VPALPLVPAPLEPAPLEPALPAAVEGSEAGKQPAPSASAATTTATFESGLIARDAKPRFQPRAGFFRGARDRRSAHEIFV